MSKCIGKPYDPSIRKTEHGSQLYNIWRIVRKRPHCEEWECFGEFYNWAMQSGYEVGMRLRKIGNKPYMPDNCVWYSREEKEAYFSDEWATEWAKKWNSSVNLIRKHYGMPPLEGTDYGIL